MSFNQNMVSRVNFYALKKTKIYLLDLEKKVKILVIVKTRKLNFQSLYFPVCLNKCINTAVS